MWKRAPARMLILLAAVLVLLPLLAFLQYRWLGQVSAAEKERMQAVLRSAAAQFGERFDRELTRAYSTFQHPEESKLERLPEDYAERLEHWNATASHPQIVREVFLAVTDATGSEKLMRFNATARQFETGEWPNELAALRQRAANRVAEYIDPALPALLIPPKDAIRSEEKEETASAPRVLCTVLLLDLEYIKHVFIAALARQYFSSGKALEYDLAIVRRGEPQNVIYETRPGAAKSGASSDAVADFFDVRLETLLGSASSDAGRVIRVVKRQRIVAGGQEETHGHWRLLVRHRAGSLEQAVANGRRWNLAISFGVLLLLGVSVALIAVSSGRATRLAQEQMKFVAGVTHELRTPLAVICSAGENLADAVVSERQQIQQYGGLIRDEGRRLSQMVEQVLEYAGTQSGGPADRFQTTDMRNVVEKALRDCSQSLEQGGFELRTEVEPNLPPVNGDAAALQRAIQNLLNNAMKYDSGNRSVVLRARRATADELQLTVEDRGRGIPAGDLPHIFEPFFRGADVVAQIQGSGLGLSLVQHIVTAHGGRVTVESTPGQGSAFTLHLPVAREGKA